ncbi:glycosyltransferase family 2 protein [Candidatus Falkowbacteria bacterium CG10_big_fil_rev_8_21_14_0_10_44_15]|uniref:Glycosyltransferase family 2 protein n=1 Tax=Candidatus Falkowbacteria bacterium CG10_big_fil_rev_8_21_14_0_10_44_15 TaxID=1974569 RepID=A0A2H0V076_9BACT|nr:MAG: glycosyltransferase family 2 protein [Candidatus Falkowbacteria bacterium CG10_big_fil_rev_8_21_14_0_10_44_15]
MTTINSISIFFPCYNDKGTVEKLLNDSVATINKLGVEDYEIIFIDDGSTDGARELLASLQGRTPNFKVILHEKNFGYGRVLRSGFAAASKEWIFYSDGDAQYDVKELPLLISALEEGVDFVSGYKMKRNDSLSRIILGKVYQWGIKIIFMLKIRDVDCNFRLIRKYKMDQITLRSDSGSVCLELVKKLQNAKAIMRQVPVHHYSRIYGHSQFFNIKRINTMVITLFKLWWPLVILKKTK